MSTTELPIVIDTLKIKALTYINNKTPLTIEDIDIPVVPKDIVQPDELLVENKATSLNPIDCVFKELSSMKFCPKQTIIGGDFAGTVVKAGSKTKFKAGDNIYGLVFKSGTRGSCSNYILFKPEDAITCEIIPKGMTFEEAGSSPTVSATAFQTVSAYKGDLKDKNILVLGGGTSVGAYSIQFAKHYFKAGKVVATCSPRSAKKALQYGADVTIDYNKGDQYKIDELLKFVKENGKFDLIVDTIRDESPMPYFSSLLKTNNEKGLFSQVGGSYSNDYTKASLFSFLPSYKYISNSIKYKVGLSKYETINHRVAHSETYGKAMETLFKSGQLQFPIDSIKDAYTDGEEAFEKVATSNVSGKVVLKW
ncbi:Yim1 protein [Pichia kluyveri]|uniref:Yim1 protein n=1 Tax=Pichia kluyveri TaxID=36015 RepID=A0AAV5R5M1_PICKL|nr:Yim1 protein [Pichia kluyveri]